VFQFTLPAVPAPAEVPSEALGGARRGDAVLRA
jgi:hypothetical protein